MECRVCRKREDNGAGWLCRDHGRDWNKSGELRRLQLIPCGPGNGVKAMVAITDFINRMRAEMQNRRAA